MPGYLRITTALVFGSIIITGALYMSATSAAQSPEGAVRVVANTPAAYVPPTDADDNGVLDWEEGLSAHINRAAADLPDMSPTNADGVYAAPETLTGQFSERFFEQYVRASAGQPLTEDAQRALVANAASSLTAQTQDRVYRRSDIHTGDADDLGALRTYGNAVSEIILANEASGEEAPEVVLQRALAADDPEMLTLLDRMAAAYGDALTQLEALAVPPSQVQTHIDLLNASNAVTNDIAAMANAFDDPLTAMLRVKRYQEDLIGLQTVFQRLYTNLDRADVRYTSDEPGAAGAQFIR